MTTDPETKPVGVLITIKDIHENVNKLLGEVSRMNNLHKNMVDLEREQEALEERTRRLEVQNAAHWVVHTLTVGGIAAAIGRIFT